MNSNNPYLLKAFFDWIVDNQCTPYIIVDAQWHGVLVPLEFVKNGQVVLNIAPRAVSDFTMSHEAVSFSTRFGGMPVDLYLPALSILGIYAQENGKGMMFDREEDLDPPPTQPKIVKGPSDIKGNPKPPSEKIKPSLRVVK